MKLSAAQQNLNQSEFQAARQLAKQNPQVIGVDTDQLDFENYLIKRSKDNLNSLLL